MSFYKHIAVTGILLLCGMAAGQTAPGAPMKINVPSQILGDALNALAAQTGIQIIFNVEDIMPKAITAPSVVGNLTPEAALKALLANTNVRYKFVDSKTVALSVVKNKEKTPLSSERDDTVAWGTEREVLLALTEGTAQDAEDATSKKQSKSAKKAADGVEEMIVEESKMKPFGDANLDLPRTTNDPQPYYIFDSETIKRSAATNIEEFLKQRLTMNTSIRMNSQRTGSTPEDSGQGGLFDNAGNTSAINLRGLGTDKTLILVNGRRRANVVVAATGNGYTTSSQPDLNGIPIDAIERIEVLPTSASAIYGGGAIGGVINVVLKRDYVGGSVRLSYDNVADKDAPNRNMSASYGVQLGKTQISFNASWADSQPLLFQDRRGLYNRGLETLLRNDPNALYTPTNPFLGSLPNITSTSSFDSAIYNSVLAATGDFTTAYNAAYTPDPGTLTLKNGTPLGSRNTFVSAGTSPGASQAQVYQSVLNNAGRWNFELPATTQNPTGLIRQLSQETKVQSFSMSISRPLNSWLEVSLDLSRADNDAVLFVSPFGNSSYTIPKNAAINPFISDIIVRIPDTYGIDTPAGTQSNNASLGFKVTAPGGWVGQADLSWSKNNTDNLQILTSYTTLSADILGGQFNPLVDTLMYPLNFEKYARPYARDFHSYQKGITLRASGPLMMLWSGTPSLTFGMERSISGTPKNYLHNTRDLQELIYYPRQRTSDNFYVETLIPLIKQGTVPLVHALEVQVAGRTERSIEGSGSRSARYSSVTGALIDYEGAINGLPYFSETTYSSHNETFGLKYQPVADLIVRASLATAFIPPTSVQLALRPAAPTPATILDPKNNRQQFIVPVFSGGNPDLKPQRSKSLNAGIIWEPANLRLRGLRANLEYYRIQQFDAISILGAQQLLDNEDSYAERVTRNAQGRIALLDTSYINLYSRDTSGWDLTLDYPVKTKIGTFNLTIAESMILHIRNQYSLTRPADNSVNFPSEGGAAKYKSSLQLAWERGNWSAGWSTQYVSSYKQYGAVGGPTYWRCTPNCGTNSIVIRQGSDTIPSQTYHDMFVGYGFDKAVRAGGWFGAGLLSDTVIRGGVKNVFNKAPHFDVQYDFFASPYGDLRLRSYWLSVQKSF